MPKFFFRALILMLFIAIGQPAMSSLASDLGDGTAPIPSDVLMVKNPEKIFSKSKEELENIVAERFSALADAGEGDATFYYMPADVFEGAAKAGNDEDKISDLLLKSMLYVVEVGSVQNFSHIL